MMKLSDFDYYLPKELIAQFPAKPRGTSRLLVLNRKRKSLEHRQFGHLLDCIKPGDVLVLNDTKVFPARLLGAHGDSGKKMELLLLEKTEENIFNCLARPLKHIKIGDTLVYGEGKLKARILSKEKFLKAELCCNAGSDLKEVIWQVGKMPLPPYIKRAAEKEDLEDYQTVYAKCEGAVAAPTAGLHFTEDILEKFKAAGVKITNITLHTGYGTFAPVREDDLTNHNMHREYFSISPEAAELINRARQEGGRIFAVGTTTCRALESAFKDGELKPLEGNTELFIYPPYKFKVADAMVTNFHLPKTTLLMLVSAFCGSGSNSLSADEAVKFLLGAYNQAVKEKYRFYSYGDAMLIL